MMGGVKDLFYEMSNRNAVCYAQDLGRDIVGRADGHVALDGAVVAQLEAGSEIGQPDVSVGVEEDVVRFDVAVDVAQPVDRVDSQHHLGQIEFGHVLGQAILKLGQERQQIPAAVVIHHQILPINSKSSIIMEHLGSILEASLRASLRASLESDESKKVAKRKIKSNKKREETWKQRSGRMGVDERDVTP